MSLYKFCVFFWLVVVRFWIFKRKKQPIRDANLNILLINMGFFGFQSFTSLELVKNWARE